MIQFQQAEFIRQLIVACIDPGIATLKEQLEIVRVNLQSLVIAIANQLAVTDVFRPSRHPILERNVADSRKGFLERGSVWNWRPFSVETIRCPRAIVARRADGFDQE